MTDDDVKRVTFLLCDLLVNDDLATEDIARAAMGETLRMAARDLRAKADESVATTDWLEGVMLAADWLNTRAQEIERD